MAAMILHSGALVFDTRFSEIYNYSIIRTNLLSREINRSCELTSGKVFAVGGK